MHFVISTQTQYKDICHTQNDFRPALFWHKIRLSLFAKTGNIKSYRKNIDKPHEFVFEGWYCLWILILLRPAAFGFGFSGCLKAVCLSGVTSTYFFSFVLLLPSFSLDNTSNLPIHNEVCDLCSQESRRRRGRNLLQ